MRIFSIIFFILFSTTSALSAEDIDYSCLKSINVSSNKSIDMGNHSVSCLVAERHKNDIYEILEKNDYEYVINNIRVAEFQLKELERKLQDEEMDFKFLEEDENRDGIGLTLSAVGLAGCITTGGAGCIIIAIAAISVSEDSLRDSINSKDEGIEYINFLREKLRSARNEIKRHEGKLPSGYDDLTQSFNSYCKIIESECL